MLLVNAGMEKLCAVSWCDSNCVRDHGKLKVSPLACQSEHDRMSFREYPNFLGRPKSHNSSFPDLLPA